MKRRVPPAPPASSTRQASSRYKPLAFARPPLRRDSATESSFVPSEREPLRLRIRADGAPSQRPMPRRVVASPIGGSAPPRLQTTSQRSMYGEYHGQSHVRDDRSYAQEDQGGWQGQRDYAERGHLRPAQDEYQRPEGYGYQQERHDWGSAQRGAPSMGHRDPTWSEQRQSGQYYQDWSQQQSTTQERWQDPQQGHQQYPSQQGAAAQYWPNQPPQSQQQQMPTLPAPVFPPGMQPVGTRPPPGLGPNVQRTRQGVMSQSASIQYGSAASRQQSPHGSQPPQGSAAERQQSPFGQQPPSTGGYFRQGYQ